MWFQPSNGRSRGEGTELSGDDFFLRFDAPDWFVLGWLGGISDVYYKPQMTIAQFVSIGRQQASLYSMRIVHSCKMGYS